MPARKLPTAKPKPGTAGTPTALILPEKLVTLVHHLRHEKVILDSDLAELYGVETSALNRAAKRNIERFPADFMFQLTENEAAGLRCQSGILKRGQHRKIPPLRLHRARCRHALQRAAFSPCSGGEHRHHAYLRPTPAADGLQRPPRRDPSSF